MSQYRIFADGKELFLLKEAGAVPKKGIELTSPDGVKLLLKLTTFARIDLEYSDAKGYMAVLEEQGTLAERLAGRPVSLMKEEIKTLSKANRPASVESLDYVQYRIKASGVLPVR